MSSLGGNNLIKEIVIESIERDVFSSKKIVILFFQVNEWNLCSETELILTEIAEKYKKNVDIYKIDFRKYRELAKEFQIVSLPTLIYFYKGIEKRRTTGSQTKQQIEMNITTIK